MRVGTARVWGTTMNAAPPRLAARAAELRLAFDHSFISPARIETMPKEDLLAIRIGSDAYAIRLSEVAGIFSHRKITRVPGRIATLLGIAGFRGTIVPVYSLPALLGHPTVESPRWLVVALKAPVALAFETLESHLRVARDAILARDGDDRARLHVHEFVEDRNQVRGVVHLGSVLDEIVSSINNVSPRGGS
jgi:chemotaxis signal transduction protein